jgi:hypothetical protein
MKIDFKYVLTVFLCNLLYMLNALIIVDALKKHPNILTMICFILVYGLFASFYISIGYKNRKLKKDIEYISKNLQEISNIERMFHQRRIPIVYANPLVVETWLQQSIRKN